MKHMRIEAPDAADFEKLATFPLRLREECHAAPVIEVDFGAIRFVTPAWLVIVGGALRRLREERADAKRKAYSFQHLGYAAHMGFFRYFGMDFGKEPAEARGS